MPTQAQYGQNAQPDPNAVPGWSVQGSASQTALGAGVPSAGYARPGLTASAAALTSTGNGTPGAPSPIPGNVTDILANPGYADAAPSLVTPLTPLPAGVVPVPASGTAFPNPSGLTCQVTITGSVSSVKVGGVQAGTAAGTYTVPAGATVALTYTTAPTWSWVTV